MSITLIVGTPGAGKSYTAIEKCILPAIKQGRRVFTNIPINMPLIEENFTDYFDNDFITVDDSLKQEFIDNLKQVDGGVLIVLDELWQYWDCTKKKPDEDSETIFAKHRHKLSSDGLSQDIVILTQGTQDVPIWIRTRVDSTIIARKLSSLGLLNRYRLNYYTGCVSSLRPPKSKLVGEEYGAYNKDIYKYYQSHTLSVAGAGVPVREVGTMKNRTIFGGVRLVGFFSMFVIVLLVLSYRFAFFDSGIMTNSVKSVPKVVESNKSIPKKVEPNKPVPKKSEKVEPKINSNPLSSAANRFWIVGYFKDDILGYKVILYDGSNYLNLNIGLKDCIDNGILFCKVSNTMFTSIPLPKSVVAGVSP